MRESNPQPTVYWPAFPCILLNLLFLKFKTPEEAELKIPSLHSYEGKIRIRSNADHGRAMRKRITINWQFSIETCREKLYAH
jgi:hypothetical protein